MKKSAFALLTCGLTTLIMSSNTSEATATYTLNFGTVAPEGTPWADHLQAAKRRIERDSNGEIQVRVFLGGALGYEDEMVEDIIAGQRLQGGGITTASVAQGANVPLLMMPELPYLFRNLDEVDAVLDQVLWDPVADQLSERGLVMGAWAENGWRNFATTGPVTSPEELAQYKMRSQESPVHLAMYEAFGVQAVAKPVSEVLPALNTGIVDGFDNTPLFSLAAGWLGPISHYTLSEHIYQPAAIVFSERFLDTLTPELRAVVLGDRDTESSIGRVGVRELQSQLISSISESGKTVVTLTDEQRRVFARQSRDVRRHFVVDHPELAEIFGEVQSLLRSMRQ